MTTFTDSILFDSETIALIMTLGETFWNIGGAGSDHHFPQCSQPHHLNNPNIVLIQQLLEKPMLENQHF